MKKIIQLSIFLVCFLSVAALTGCTTRANSGAGNGALGGAAIGSIAGDKNRGRNTAIGAVLGSILGYAIGNEMDKFDRHRLNSAFEQGRSYEPTEWVNPDSGNQYTVTPSPPSTHNGQVCREAEIQSYIDGRPETVVTKACRRPDGRWETV